jgi:hypothetical protein
MNWLVESRWGIVAEEEVTHYPATKTGHGRQQEASDDVETLARSQQGTGDREEEDAGQVEHQLGRVSEYIHGA